LKIAILGTRGIPNNYGGFEQFAEHLSPGLIQKGHDVYVYCPHNHAYREDLYKSVKLLHIHNPESYTGTFGMFIYDLLCILDARKRKFDLIYQLGYTSSSVWWRLMPRDSLVVTNMDGLEWKRSKYNRAVKRFLRYAEKLAIQKSHHLVADSKGIQGYIGHTYRRKSTYLPYGAEVFNKPDPSGLAKYGVIPFRYNLVISRLVPENSIEIILQGAEAAGGGCPLLVVGNHDNGFGRILKKKFGTSSSIIFLPGEYEPDNLNNLRHFCRMYFHGHTVGGTNPSLLEAMGAGAMICAQKNEFNYAVLGETGYYFESVNDVKKFMELEISVITRQTRAIENREKIRHSFSWSHIIDGYDTLFRSLLRSE
jgi:glycosyltransferase involved in cell wall biosynthesis